MVKNYYQGNDAILSCLQDTNSHVLAFVELPTLVVRVTFHSLLIQLLSHAKECFAGLTS